MHRLVPVAQEVEELDPLPQAPLHHFRALDHLAQDRGDLARAEIEAAVESLDRIEDLGVAQAGITQRRDLPPVIIHEVHVDVLEPAVLDRLLVKERPWVWRRQGNLERMWVHLLGEIDCLLDRLLRLARKTQDERAMDPDAELAAILGEPLGDIDPHTLLDVVEDLLVSALIADEQRLKPLSRSTLSVARGTLALALHDQTTPSLPSSRAIASARGRLSVNVSSSKKNSLTSGKAAFAHFISSMTWPTERVR